MSIQKSINSLKASGVIAYPTETLWGLGTDYDNKQAIEKIFALKGREKTQAISLLVSDISMAKTLAKITEQQQKLMLVFWPGPLTFVLPATDKVLPEIHGGTQFVGLRCSPHPFVQGLIWEYGRAITTTSANKSGSPSATTRQDLKWLPDEVYTVEDANEMTQESKGSTVIKLVDDHYQLLREGDLSLQAFQQAAKLLGFSARA